MIKYTHKLPTIVEAEENIMEDLYVSLEKILAEKNKYRANTTVDAKLNNAEELPPPYSAEELAPPLPARKYVKQANFLKRILNALLTLFRSNPSSEPPINATIQFKPTDTKASKLDVAQEKQNQFVPIPRPKLTQKEDNDNGISHYAELDTFQEKSEEMVNPFNLVATLGMFRIPRPTIFERYNKDREQMMANTELSSNRLN